MLGLALASGQVWRLADAAATSPQSSSATGLYFDHVLLIMMENQNINSTYNCGSLCDQFLTPFANSNGLALNYQRVIDGSLPNYFALTMGQINTYPFLGPTVHPISILPTPPGPNIVLKTVSTSWIVLRTLV